MEIWKNVIGYEGYYEVSNLGNVRSVNRIINTIDGKQFSLKSKLLKQAISRDGYKQIGVSINGKTFSYYVHILVAKAFIINLDNKPTVNHKDGVKINNNILNLEWATKSEQAIHSLKNNLRKMPNSWIGKFGSKHGASKRIEQIDYNGNVIAEYGSIIEAGKILNIKPCNITNVLRGRTIYTSDGYNFRFKKLPLFL